MWLDFTWRSTVPKGVLTFANMGGTFWLLSQTSRCEPCIQSGTSGLWSHLCETSEVDTVSEVKHLHLDQPFNLLTRPLRHFLGVPPPSSWAEDAYLDWIFHGGWAWLRPLVTRSCFFLRLMSNLVLLPLALSPPIFFFAVRLSSPAFCRGFMPSLKWGGSPCSAVRSLSCPTNRHFLLPRVNPFKSRVFPSFYTSNSRKCEKHTNHVKAIINLKINLTLSKNSNSLKHGEETLNRHISGKNPIRLR